MMTPQEVASHAFAKATLGGYNLAQVDEFLDALTEDYSALYNENAILKNKLKVLSETVEEYRATDNAMRKTLLAAQQMADAMVTEAKQKQSELVSEAEKGAQQRVTELQKSIAAEEYRLKKAQESTAAYVRRLAEFHDKEMDFLSNLGELVPPELVVKDDPAVDIEAAVAAQVRQEEAEQQQAASVQERPAPRLVAVGPDDDIPPMPDDILLPSQADLEEELDPDATRRFSDIQFGKDYRIE
jgi:cell division initiation protein